MVKVVNVDKFEPGDEDLGSEYILTESPHPPPFLLSPIDFWEESEEHELGEPHPLLEGEEEDDPWAAKGCLCNGEKLFCQNLRLVDLRFIPQDVEFL